MTKTDLRTLIVEQANRALNHAWVLGLSQHDRAVIEAQRDLFASDDTVLDLLYARLPQSMKGLNP